MPLQKIYLELTNQCNLNCTICYRQAWSEKPQDMTEELFRKIKKEIKEIQSVQGIVLGGIGEATRAPLLAEALEELRDYHLTLTTNGSSLSSDLLESIVKHVKYVIVSIDGLHETFTKIRGADLESVLDNIKTLNRLKQQSGKQHPLLAIQVVIFQDNSKDLFKLIDLASGLNADTLILSNLLPQTKENAEKILYTRYENKAMKSLFNRLLNYSFLRGIKLLLPSMELKTERKCNFIENKTIFITAAGEAVPCYRLSHTYREFVFGREKQVLKHSFGNINLNKLSEIWESKEYVEFRERISNNKYPSCLDCDLAEGCDLVKDTSMECYAGIPSCADCLWTRKFIICI